MTAAEISGLRAEAEAALVAALIVEPEQIEELRGWFDAGWLEDERHFALVEALLQGVSLRGFAQTCDLEERRYFRDLAGCVVSDNVRHYGLALHALRRRQLEAMARSLMAEAARPALAPAAVREVCHAA